MIEGDVRAIARVHAVFNAVDDAHFRVRGGNIEGLEERKIDRQRKTRDINDVVIFVAPRDLVAVDAGVVAYGFMRLQRKNIVWNVRMSRDGRHS